MHTNAWTLPDLWRFAWRTQPLRYGFLTTIAFIHFCLDLYLALVMSALITSPNRANLGTLIGLLAGRVGLWWLKGLVDAQAYRENCRLVAGRLQRTDVGAESRDQLQRALSVDVPHLLEGLRVTYTFIHIAASLLAGTAVLFYLSGTAAVLAVLAIAGFIPLTLLISSKRSTVNRRLFEIVQSRAAAVSAWLEHEVRLRAWSASEAVTSRLEQEARTESSLRTVDGTWRALDLYSAAFGKVVPVSVALLGAALFSTSAHESALATLWVVIFIVNLLLQVSRYRPIFALGQAAFESLRGLTVRSVTGEEIVFDDTWDLIEGTLGENVGDETGMRFAKEFRLDRELGGSSFADHRIERFGGNVSNGQRTRILLARAMSVAHRSEGATLLVRRSLASLDPSMRRRVLRVLDNQSQIRITLETATDLTNDDWSSRGTGVGDAPDGSSASCESVDERIASTSATEVAHREGMLRTFRKMARVTPCLLMSIVPLLLVLSGSVADADAAPGPKAIWLLAIGCTGVLLGIGFAVWIEVGVRRWARRHFARQLDRPTATSHADQLQKLTRDYTNVINRIASYVHDLTWFGFLWLVTLAGVILVFPLMGTLLALVTASGYGWIWWRLAPSLVATRRALATGLNRYVDTFDDAIALGNGAAHPVLARELEATVDRAMARFYRCNIEQIVVKHSVRTMAILSSAVSISAFGVAVTMFSGHSVLMSLAATGLLNLDLRVSVLFAGLAGFEALRESALRLENCPELSLDEERPVTMTYDNEFITIPTLYSDVIDRQFQPWQMARGRVTSLVGPSGSGKSVYCSLLARDRQRVLYLGAQAADALKLLAREEEGGDGRFDVKAAVRTLCRKRRSSGVEVLVFDEALTQLRPGAALELAESIACEEDGVSAVILVDHRITADRSIRIRELSQGVR